MRTREINEVIGRKIALLLEINSMSQSELARRVGYSNHTAVSQIVRGAKGPGKAMMKKIAEELGVPESFLSDKQEYDFKEWKAIQKLQKILKNKNADPGEYRFVMEFFDRL